jgi:hypothetical protein
VCDDFPARQERIAGCEGRQVTLEYKGFSAGRFHFCGDLPSSAFIGAVVHDDITARACQAKGYLAAESATAAGYNCCVADQFHRSEKLTPAAAVVKNKLAAEAAACYND